MTALAADALAPGRIEFSTTDSALAIDNLKNVYGTNFEVSGARDGYVFAHSRLDGGSFALDDLRVPLNVRVRQDPFNSLVVVLLRAGRFGRECGGIDERFLPGDVFIDAEPGLPSTVRLLHVELQTIMLDLGVLAQVAATSSSRAPGPVRFTGYQPVSPAAAAHWRNTTRYLGELLANPEAAAQPLIRGNGARLLAATALATFPNTAVIAPSGRDRSDATSATVRRAVAFIEQHADADISLADIAAAANVSHRAVQFAFRRHRDTTPVAYLRAVRLDHVHRELLAADPGGGDTVAQIAARWGFYNHSRFAAHYRHTFGVSPHHTLRDS
ncbi:helix-turn-helix domain-containing protein [Pseudonocardia sp. Cha107L01]|jgi:AraC-like DNA-binding protein|uniref:helix-turn-helix domain-containing protein n=1 Tax=Pseudonocardia sp. Cha107L01 TaxID=3457576 RepID=UPI00403E7722